MTARPADDYDPDDPVEILLVLPARFHGQFLAEYDAAVAGARQPEQYRQLHHLLRPWRLSAVAFSDPGYEAMRHAVEEAVRAGRSCRAPAIGRMSYRPEFEGDALVHLNGLPRTFRASFSPAVAARHAMLMGVCIICAWQG